MRSFINKFRNFYWKYGVFQFSKHAGLDLLGHVVLAVILSTIVKSISPNSWLITTSLFVISFGALWLFNYSVRKKYSSRN